MNNAWSREQVPSTDHVARYCNEGKWSCRNGGGFTIRPSAFRNSRDPDGGISVFWMERFEGDEQHRLKRIRKTSTYQGFTPEGRFLKLKVCLIEKIEIENGTPLKAFKAPNGKNVSHAEILPTGQAVFKQLAHHAQNHGVLLEPV